MCSDFCMKYAHQPYSIAGYSQDLEHCPISKETHTSDKAIHMRPSFPPKIVTANDLIHGDVVYLSANGQWVRQHKDAELLLDAALSTERLAFAQTQHAHVVGAYLADAIAGSDGPIPVHFRDAFRARGPSNLPHGKQSELENVSV